MPETWSFIQLSDIHLGDPDSHRFQPAWIENFEQVLNQISALEHRPEFVLVTGDLTRDGKTRPSELEAARARLEALEWPVYSIPGNHDIGNRYREDKDNTIKPEVLQTYRNIMGSDRFTLDRGDLRLAGFNSILLGTGFEEEEEHWQWLQAQSVLSGPVRRQVWFMHTAPFFRTPEEPELEREHDTWHLITGHRPMTRLLPILDQGNVLVLGYGHIHVYHDRIVGQRRYISCPSTAFRLRPAFEGDNEQGFLEWTVTPDSVRAERHLLQKVSTLPGFGNNPGV